MNSTFDRSHVKDILSSRLDEYIKEFESDVTLNETNIHDKTLLRSAIAAKWCRYEYEEKRYKDKLTKEIDDIKNEIAQRLFEQKKNAIANQIATEAKLKIDAERIVKTHPKYLQIKKSIEDQDEIIRFIGEAKQIISQFGFDIKNSIEILKLEQI